MHRVMQIIHFLEAAGFIQIDSSQSTRHQSLANGGPQLPVDLNPIDEVDEMADIDEEDVEYDPDEQAEIIQHMLLSPMVCTVIQCTLINSRQ